MSKSDREVLIEILNNSKERWQMGYGEDGQTLNEFRTGEILKAGFKRVPIKWEIFDNGTKEANEPKGNEPVIAWVRHNPIQRGADKLRDRVISGYMGDDGFYIYPSGQLAWDWDIYKWTYINDD